MFYFCYPCAHSLPPPPPPLKIFYNKGSFYSKNYQIDTNDGNIFQIFIFASGILSLLWLSLLPSCDHVKYISFNTNFSRRRKERIVKSPDCFWSYLSLNMLGLLLCECPDFSLLIFIISLSNTKYGSVVNLTLKVSKIVSRFIFSILSIYIYSISLTPVTCIISLMVFQIWCHSLRKNVPFWLPTILIVK